MTTCPPFFRQKNKPARPPRVVAGPFFFEKLFQSGFFMLIKKIGKAFIDLEDELWCIEGKPLQFFNDRRLVDTRPDVKEVKKGVKIIQRDTPSRRQSIKREAYFKDLEDYQRQLKECLAKVYAEMLEDTFTQPLALRKHRDYDHNSEARYGLYQGYVYEFDKPNYSPEEMLQKIQAMESKKHSNE